MKVIFLDIDGVLNHQSHYEWLMTTDEPTLMQRTYPYTEFNPKSCQLLKEIIEETGAQIVVSSSWRLDGEKRLNSLFKHFGLPKIYSITPCLNTMRGLEIGAWLASHPEVTNYVILDDDEDMCEHQLPFYIKTNPYGDGLNEEVKERAIQLLNNTQPDEIYREVLRNMVKDDGQPEDLLYAWGIARGFDWVQPTDQELMNYLMTEERMNYDIARWYCTGIQTILSLGEEKSKQFLEEDFDFESLGVCIPWEE